MTVRETTCPSHTCEPVNAAALQYGHEGWCGSLTASYLVFTASHRAISCLKQLVRCRGASKRWGLGLFSSLEAQMCTAVTCCLFVSMQPGCVIFCPLFSLLPTMLPAFHWKENGLRTGGWVMWCIPGSDCLRISYSSPQTNSNTLQSLTWEESLWDGTLAASEHLRYADWDYGSAFEPNFLSQKTTTRCRQAFFVLQLPLPAGMSQGIIVLGEGCESQYWPICLVLGLQWISVCKCLINFKILNHPKVSFSFDHSFIFAPVKLRITSFSLRSFVLEIMGHSYMKLAEGRWMLQPFSKHQLDVKRNRNSGILLDVCIAE